MTRFSVCALSYNGSVTWFQRWASSLRRWFQADLIADVRVGLNEPSEELLREARAQLETLEIPVHLLVTRQNVGKYPVMRRLFWHMPTPLSDATMWFDDDSYVDGPGLFSDCSYLLEHQADVLGFVWRMKLAGRQGVWLTKQPWYRGQAVTGFLFPTGGWWAVKTPVLERWNWPAPELHHSGGDRAFGELCRQQGYKVLDYVRTKGLDQVPVRVNADGAGKHCAAPRRGLSSGAPAIGVQDVSPPPRPDFYYEIWRTEFQ